MSNRSVLSGLVCIAGIVLIVIAAPWGVPARIMHDIETNRLLVFGTLPLMSFLWLATVLFIPYTRTKRSDFVAAIPFLIALAIRELLTIRGLEEVESLFYVGVIPGRNSLLHAMFEMYVQNLARQGDPFAFMQDINAFLGALATVPLFIFVRQRTGNRQAAFLAALFFAVHPVISRFSRTDGQHSLMLLTWFAGLAFLSMEEPNPIGFFMGVLLVVIAATGRKEGGLYFLASLFLLDLRPLIAFIRREPVPTSLSAVIGAAIFLFNFVSVATGIFDPKHPFGNFDPVTVDLLFRSNFISPHEAGSIYTCLCAAGILAGLAHKSFRLGPAAMIAAIIVTLPIVGSERSFGALHRMVMTYGLTSISAGIGATWVTQLLSSYKRSSVALIPALALAASVLLFHSWILQKKFVFNEEFDLLRTHLGPLARVPSACKLLTFNSRLPGSAQMGDDELHSFEQVLPDIAVVDCVREDCVKAASAGGCYYYYRPARCSFKEETPRQCLMPSGNGSHPPSCVEEACVSLEASLQLSPVEIQEVRDVDDYFGTIPYPDRLEIELARVDGVKTLRTAGAPQ